MGVPVKPKRCKLRKARDTPCVLSPKLAAVIFIEDDNVPE